MSEARHSCLRRLPATAYQGHAYIHWSMTMQDRVTGWLDESFHATFRELLTHTCARHGIICPTYCLMPDHMHLLLIGLRLESDQRKAMPFLRKHLNRTLATQGFQMQGQPYDNVLREKDRNRNAFMKTLYYIAENPVRDDLVRSAEEWPFSGSLSSGYPWLDWRSESFEKLLWQIVESHAAKDI